MAKSGRGKTKNERPSSEVVTFTFRLDPELNEAWESYIERQRFKPTKNVILEQLLRDFLRSEGALPKPHAPEQE